ncbi:MAG: hypothetical protein DRP22_02485 [Verrucomicrobia bacterium]|nr:MAG: hypothetical protein DRP22_02485 [Verrucomicrobiota bacterium]
MTTPDPDTADPSRRHRSRAPLILSCLVYPGAGQALQKRWLPAGIFALLFTVCLTGLFFSVLVPVWKNVTAALSFAESGGSGIQFAGISLARVLAWLIAGLAIYAANAVDAYLHS